MTAELETKPIKNPMNSPFPGKFNAYDDADIPSNHTSTHILVAGLVAIFGLFSHINIGLLSSSQLTKSYFSEGFFPNPQPDSISNDFP